MIKKTTGTKRVFTVTSADQRALKFTFINYVKSQNNVCRLVCRLVIDRFLPGSHLPDGRWSLARVFKMKMESCRLLKMLFMIRAAERPRPQRNHAAARLSLYFSLCVLHSINPPQ